MLIYRETLQAIVVDNANASVILFCNLHCLQSDLLCSRLFYDAMCYALSRFSTRIIVKENKTLLFNTYLLTSDIDLSSVKYFDGSFMFLLLASCCKFFRWYHKELFKRVLITDLTLAEKRVSGAGELNFKRRLKMLHTISCFSFTEEQATKETLETCIFTTFFFYRTLWKARNWRTKDHSGGGGPSRGILNHCCLRRESHGSH